MTNLYHKLFLSSPYFIKCFLASLRGEYLKNIRYGKNIEKLICDAQEREYWSNDQWNDWKQFNLCKLIEKASEIPFYRNYEFDLINSNIELIPVLEKGNIRKISKELIVHPDIKKIFCDYTSGSTGTPLSIWIDYDSVKFWYAICERRWRNWYGLNMKDRWAIFGGQLIKSQKNNRPPYWVYNSAFNQLYFSIYHISDSSIKYYIQKLFEFKPVYIYGYSSSLFSISSLIAEKGLKVPKLKKIITNAEPLYSYQKKQIEKVFQTECIETYGMAETVAAASMCEYNSMHAWPETGLWEILDLENNKLKIGQAGRLISTGFINKTMPLIRYDTGDVISMLENKQCKCGRTLPIIKKILGRDDDLIITPDGNRVGRLDPIFKNNFNINEAQVVQDSKSSVIVNIVADSNFSKKDENNIIFSMQKYLGNMNILIKKCSAIKRERNGKLKSVVNLMDEKKNGK